MMLNTTC